MNMKKATVIVAIVMGALLLGAVILGVLNGLLAGGAWNFGWNDYRYDDSAYSVGEGTLYAPLLTHIDVDWIDGKVEIVACEDQYPSLSERCDSELTEESRVHWYVSEDGKSLSVKYRASSGFFGSIEGKSKDLILRIPKKMMGGLESLVVHSVSSPIVLSGIEAKKFEVSGVSGVILLDDCGAETLSLTNVSGAIDASLKQTPKSIQTDNVSGETVLSIPKDSGFSLGFETVSGGNPLVDFATTQKDGRILCGDGRCRIDTKSVSGSLRVTYP
ncbi:MAG: DUF4097 family beta strand repeat protein [Clostridia bacterium]|nr:DUF4097 family beta strand repeat protein [Clostridia bacterium]